MYNYLPNNTDYTDIPVQEPEPDYGKTIECPVCHGHGKFNLRLNAYGKGQHFQGVCQQCNGFGWVGEEDSVCVHKFVEKPSGVMFDHPVECKKCGQRRVYDSSG